MDETIEPSLKKLFEHNPQKVCKCKSVMRELLRQILFTLEVKHRVGQLKKKKKNR